MEDYAKKLKDPQQIIEWLRGKKYDVVRKDVTGGYVAVAMDGTWADVSATGAIFVRVEVPQDVLQDLKTAALVREYTDCQARLHEIENELTKAKEG